jgi:hypothetical protein
VPIPFDPWQSMTVAADVALASRAAARISPSERRAASPSFLESAVQTSSRYRHLLRKRGGRPCPADMPVAGKAELMLSFDTWCCDPALRLEPLRQFVADPRNEAPVPCASTAAAATRRAVGAPASCSA